MQSVHARLLSLALCLPTTAHPKADTAGRVMSTLRVSCGAPGRQIVVHVSSRIL